MNNTTTNTENIALDIDAELDQLINASAAYPETTEVVGVHEVDLDAVVQEIEIETIKREAYAEQPADEVGSVSLVEPINAEPAVAEEPTTTTTIIAAGAPTPKGAPKRPSELVSKGFTAEQLQKAAMLVVGDTASSSTVDTLFDRIDKLAKKVGEKAANLVRNRCNPARIQGYTRDGLNLLIDKGEVTSKDLFAGFMGKYKEGTARSQANQLMSLFPALGIAERIGRSGLKLNPDSLIVADFKSAGSAT